MYLDVEEYTNCKFLSGLLVPMATVSIVTGSFSGTGLLERHVRSCMDKKTLTYCLSFYINHEGEKAKSPS